MLFVVRVPKDHQQRFCEWIAVAAAAKDGAQPRYVGIEPLYCDPKREIVLLRCMDQASIPSRPLHQPAIATGIDLPAVLMQSIDGYAEIIGKDSCGCAPDMSTFEERIRLFTSDLCTDEAMGILSNLFRIFPLSHCAAADGIADAVLATTRRLGDNSAGAKIRLQGFPRSVEGIVGPALAARGISFVPQWEDCTHVLSIIPRFDSQQRRRGHMPTSTGESHPKRGKEGPSPTQQQSQQKAIPVTFFFSCMARRAFEPYFASKHDRDAQPSSSSPSSSSSALANKPVCRAFSKLSEAALRSGFDFQRVERALDVGASPGGWSQYLEQCGVKQVVSVDPGELAIACTRFELECGKEDAADVAKRGEKAVAPGDGSGVEVVEEQHGAVVHVATTVQKALSSQRFLTAFSPFGAYVCDMNAPMDSTLAALESALPHLLPGSPVVVTIKFAPKKQKLLIAEAIRRVSLLGLADVKAAHLFANKNQEFTIMAVTPEA